ncbi:MAG: hypothetical protein WCT04_13025 [Planctomycetota bacterium]
MRFFVVCRIPPGTPRKSVIKLIRDEARTVWKLYETGMVRELFYLEGLSGAALNCEAESLEELKKGVETLPMIRDGLLIPEYIPLMPYTGFGKLFSKEG